MSLQNIQELAKNSFSLVNPDIGTSPEKIQDYERDPANNFMIGKNTFNQHLKQRERQLEALKNPSKVIEEQLRKEVDLRNKVQKKFMEKYILYIGPEYNMNQAQAKQRAFKYVQSIFETEYKEIEDEYEFLNVAMDTAKGKAKTGNFNIGEVETTTDTPQT